jgi:PST family polysaccharide transporter
MMHSEPQAPAASRLVQDAQSAALEPPAQRDHERFAPGGSLRTRAARGTLINTAFTVGLGALGLLKSFILAGFVSRSDYGVWGVLMVTLGTVLWLKQVGVGDKYIQQEDLDQELAFQKAFTLELALSGGLVVVMAVAVPAIVLAYGLPQLIAPSIVMAATLLISAFQAPLWVYYRRMQFARQRALAAVDPVVGFVVSVVMAAAGFGYWAFVGGLAAGVCAAAAVAVIQSPFKLRLRYTPGTFKTYTDFSLPLLVASAATLVMTWSAMIAAKLSLGVAALGVVALAATISSFTDSVDQLVTGSLYPAICAVRDKTTLLYESLVKSNRLALMWAVPFGVGITIFSPDLVRFGIGQRWHPAVVVLQVYGITAAINHVGFNWTAYFRARGQTRPIAVVNLASMASFLTVGIPLLLAFGLPGFAAGVALQALVAVALRAYYLQQIFPGFDFLRHAVRSFLPTVPAAAAVLLVRAVAPSRLGLSLGELGLYLLVTAGATWILESGLLREALSYVRGSRALPAVP